MIKVRIASIFVDDQAKAEQFYTGILGLEKKEDTPIGEHRWLTVGDQGVDFELSLEPNAHPAAKQYQKFIFDDGISATMFYVDDIGAEYDRLIADGVGFQSEPKDLGGIKVAVFDDTCGNWITLCQK